MAAYLVKVVSAVFVTLFMMGAALFLSTFGNFPMWMIVIIVFGVFYMSSALFIAPALDTPYDDDGTRPLAKDVEFLNFQFALRTIFYCGFGFVLTACIVVLLWPFSPRWTPHVGLIIAMISGSIAVRRAPRPPKLSKPFS